MCGEHLAVRSPLRMDSGSSPHVRGALGCSVSSADGFGIIPACAGSTSVACRFSTYRWDHPRMCGEHVVAGYRIVFQRGSSPHVRGALKALPRKKSGSGIIPACAGSTSWNGPAMCADWDHPRMCGEHSVPSFCLTSGWGSSPHVRGAPP